MIVPVLCIVWFLRINDHFYGKGNFHPGFLQAEKEKIFKTGYDEGTCHGLFLVKKLLSYPRIPIRENGVYGSGVLFQIEVPEDKFRFMP